jgi:RNA 2',3'-cyclic 3'-phosphodiesterase
MFTRPPEHRLFFAVRPDDETGERIVHFTEALRRRNGLGGRPIDRERLHVSMAMVDRAAQQPTAEVVDFSQRAADRVALRPFKVTFDRVQSWRASRGPLVLVGGEGVRGLERLHDALHVAHKVPPDPNFKPHVSLIWSRDFLPERVIEPFSWTVREFVLIQSVYGQSRHEVLGRWPLKGDDLSPDHSAQPVQDFQSLNPSELGLVVCDHGIAQRQRMGGDQHVVAADQAASRLEF